MGYCATGGGYIVFENDLTEDERISVGRIIREVLDVCDISNPGNPTYVDVFCDGKYYDDELSEALFKVGRVSPIKEGVIEFSGEDGAHWRYIYDNGKWYDEPGKVFYGKRAYAFCDFDVSESDVINEMELADIEWDYDMVRLIIDVLVDKKRIKEKLEDIAREMIREAIKEELDGEDN